LGEKMPGRILTDTKNWKGLYFLAVVFFGSSRPSPIYHSTFFTSLLFSSLGVAGAIRGPNYADDSKEVLHSHHVCWQAGWQVDWEDLWERNSPESALGGKSLKISQSIYQ